MINLKKTIFLSLILLFVVVVVPAAAGNETSAPTSAGETRPVLDDVGFCWKAGQMDRLMNYLQDHPKGAAKAEDAPARMICGISPHDDYLYASRIYYPLFKSVKVKEVVVFGVTHGTVRKKIGDPQDKLIFDDYKFWKGPYRDVEVSPLREHLLQNLDPSMVMVNREAHNLEHSIEALIPFLQYYNRDIKITPIMVTGMSFETMDKIASALSALLAGYIEKNKLVLGQDIFFLISADANHYGPDFANTFFGEGEQAHQLGTGSDRKFAGIYLAGGMTKERLAECYGQLSGDAYKKYGERMWCGKFSIPFGLLTVMETCQKLHPDQEKELKGKILVYSDTYSEGVLPLSKPGYGITAPFSLKHWVGFLSAGYYLADKHK